MSFTVAIVGRPNVGKSTLFNRLTGRRQAIVDDMPGVTRDRRAAPASLAGLEFTVFDTAGLEEAKEGSLQARMTEQTKQAIRDADIALMLIDARAGVLPMDKHFAKLIRSMKKPVVLAVNKAEGKSSQAAVAEAHALGLGDPIPISAREGEGFADLYEALAPFEKEFEAQSAESSEELDSNVLRIAILGRPNVGKSTLVNRMIGKERLLTGPEAGITRDAIAIAHEIGDQKIELVDTAGMRKKSNIDAAVEKMAVENSIQAMRQAHVVVVVFDAEQPLEKQDNMIAALAEQEGRAVVIAVNKWDLVEDEKAFLKAFRQRLDYVLPQLRGISVVQVSAKSGVGIGKLLKECVRAHKVWDKKLGTGELNRWLESALEAHTAPLVNGRRLKIRYITQKTARPPTFLLFANLSDIPDHYLRYLVGSLRDWFNLPGTPVRMRVRKGENPYKSH